MGETDGEGERGELDRDLDLDSGADLKAHRPPEVEHDGVLDDSEYRPGHAI